MLTNEYINHIIQNNYYCIVDRENGSREAWCEGVLFARIHFTDCDNRNHIRNVVPRAYERYDFLFRYGDFKVNTVHFNMTEPPTVPSTNRIDPKTKEVRI